jgi:hypothetical protein
MEWTLSAVILKCPSPLFFMISYKNIACVKKPDGKRN